ncbi:MAG TPA: glycoside hydrolase family 2 TIM barrel-domain containing protein [Gemmataceae bacterium]|nr:glycoside hydrolase family 2 TIM barrel-domain containing protein [Gemmataceae bacterium]
MKHLSLAIALALTWAIGPVSAADWKPAPGPLLTKWARDVSPDKVHPEYPRPQMVRKDWQNLNGVWQLAFAKEGEAPPFGKELPERILVPFPVESALSGVMKRADRLWYRRTFAVPKEWAGKRVLLHFGAVDWEANVWVNGKPVGQHKGGYDPFHFDITDALRPSGEQELVVGVFDPTNDGPQPRGKQVKNPKGIYYTPTTGIWQTVWLEPVPAAHIASIKIVPDVEAGKVLITVHGRGTKPGHRIRLRVGEGGKDLSGGETDIEKTLGVPIPQAKLWSPESPFLYDLQIQLLEGEKPVDTVQSYFGMRRISIGKDDRGITRILLNGKPYFQVGPLDQGFWPDGLYTAPTDEALKYDIEITKRLGFNATRKHVKVEPARWYYWCDRLGLLVWQDMPSGEKSVAPGKGEITRSPESAQQFERELKAMIDFLHNHPCIVMWVIFNEGWGQYDTVRLTKWTKEYDPTRLVNSASGWNDMKVGDVHDIHRYPGPGSPEPEPTRAAVLGEFGGLGLPIEGHTWSKETWGYRNTRSPEELTRRYEVLLREVYRLKEKPGLSAAIYTQITDVETEANGLLTYDRAVIKPDLGRVAAANRGDFSRAAQVHVVIATSQKEPAIWRYTTDRPADDWFRPGFDDSKWKEGPGGFGTKGTPGAVVRTEWKTGDIWLRREVTLPDGPFDDLWLSVHHDEDAEIYLNGVLAAKLPRFTTGYVDEPISPEARAALKPGKNVIAVHCRQTGGGQYIDIGLVEIKELKR